MSLAKKMISAILAAGMSILPVVSITASAVADVNNTYVYDNTISEKSKDLAFEENTPFNVFDIYDAYYEIKSQVTKPATTVTTTVTKKTTTTTTITSAPKTTSKKTTSKTVPKTTSKKTTTTTAVSKTTTKDITTTTKKSASTTSVDATNAVSTVSTMLTTAATTSVTTQVGQFSEGGYINGIDVSQWQYKIDWKAVKDSGQVDFAIIKAGWGKEYDQVDPFFHDNMQQAQAVGMDVGVYWFSYAMSVEEAKQEALVCMETIKNYSFNYPVYFDFEYQRALTTLSYATLSEMIEAFCTTLEENGYKTGVYGSGSDFEYRIYRHVLEKRPVWVAEYDTPTVSWYTGTHGIWQYSPRGRIDGIATDVDLNYCYVDYPSVVGVNPVNGVIPPATIPVTTTTDPAVTTTTTNNWSCKIFDLSTMSVDNWNDFNKEENDFAMIMADSDKLESIGENIDKAHSLGIECGVIYDCNVVTVEKIKEDIAVLDAQLSGRTLEYPLYFNIDEKNAEFGICGFEKNNAAYIATEFCSYFENKKYYVGIRAEDKALGYRFNRDLLSRYDVWQVKYNNDPNLFTGYCGIKSRYNSENGGFDIICVTDYPEIIKRIGLNGYTPQEQNLTENTENTATQEQE